MPQITPCRRSPNKLPLTCAPPRLAHLKYICPHKFDTPLAPSPPPNMLHLFLISTITMVPSSSVRKPSAPKPSSAAAGGSAQQPACSNSASGCRHSPSATLDILIFILVLCSGGFLIVSYFSYVVQSVTLIWPPFSNLMSHVHYHLMSNLEAQLIFFSSFVVLFVTFIVTFELCCGHRSRRCGKMGCKGLKKAMEFDLQLQGEELLRIGDGSKAVRDVNELPWKGGTEDNPDYECLRAELRKMAPPNGRAVLLFRDKCGCPIAKLEGWGPKRGRRGKKALALSGGADHR